MYRIFLLSGGELVANRILAKNEIGIFFGAGHSTEYLIPWTNIKYIVREKTDG